MPLEVRAVLDRPVAIYLTGETITVTVTVRNVASGRAGRECLAWGSVQLTSERLWGKAAEKMRRQPATTAIARPTGNVFASVPTVLFCEAELAPGEHKTYTCQIALPSQGLPPSWRGHLVRYSNKITVAVQHVRAAIKLMHLPVRILPSVGLESRPPPPANPFLLETAQQVTVSELVTSAVDQITAPRRPHSVAMTNAAGKVTQLTLYKKAFRLGEEVIGRLQFTDACVRVAQLAVWLETVERVVEEGEEGGREGIHEGEQSVVVHDRWQSVSACAKEDHFRLTLPMHAPPTFHTESVSVRWRVRFEFVTCVPPSVSDEGGVSTAPLSVPVETLHWKCDVFVLPCSPENAALTECGQFPGEASILI